MKSLLRKQCPWCKKMFLTYETDKAYCNDECLYKEEYSNQHPGCKLRSHKASVCKQCGLPCEARAFWCSHECRRLAAKVPEHLKKKSVAPENSKKIPYQVLNKIAEKKRVFDEKHAENTIRWGGLRPRI